LQAVRGQSVFPNPEGDLQNHFSADVVVVNVNLMLDKFTGRSRGFASVEFGRPEEAQKAVAMLHGKELGGRTLTVNIARPREERPAGGGGGFRAGGGGGGYRGGGGGGGDRGGWRGKRGGRGGDQRSKDGGDRC
jgi:RNA recognition motif-containing protein